MNTQTQFNSAWLAAQHVEVQSLVANTPVGAARNAALNDLASKGLSLDPQILQYGLPPYWVMQARIWYGYTWVPAIGQPTLQVVPGQVLPGFAPYDPHKPPNGSIKVVDPANCDLAKEYPPAVVEQPEPTPPALLVDFSRPWPDQGPGAFYATFAGQSVPSGEQHTEGGKTFVKVIVPFAFGPGWHGWRPLEVH